MLMYFGFSMMNSVKEKKSKADEMAQNENQNSAQTAMEQSTITQDQYDTGTGLSNGTVATNDPWAHIPATQPVPQQPAYHGSEGGQYQSYTEDSSQARGVGAGAEFPDNQEQQNDGGKLWFEKPAQNDPWQSYQ